MYLRSPGAGSVGEIHSQQSKLHWRMQVYASYVPGDGLKTQYDWLVLFIFMVGTYIFTMGCSLLYVDANNAEYPQQMSAYNAGGRKGKKPRYAFPGMVTAATYLVRAAMCIFHALLH